MSDALGVAIIGFGEHVRKNIVRCLFGRADVRVVGIQVRDVEAYRTAWPDFGSLFTDDQQRLISDPGVEAVYVATPNAAHFDATRRALLAGKAVWCEKPLTDSLDRTTALVELAKARALLLAEMAMYRHHAQYHALTRLLAEKAASGEALVAASARFAIPALDPGNIRYRPEAGGGALLDLGYYPLSLAVALFGEPKAIEASGGLRSESGVDLQGSARLVFPGFELMASWAIGETYANRLELTFTGSRYVASPVFSRPPDRALPIEVFDADGALLSPIRVPADDQFANLFAELCEAVRTNDSEARHRYADQALAAARIVQTVRERL